LSEIQHARFAVNETPYCLWDSDFQKSNLDFINSIDPRYFEHIANLHRQFLEGKEKQYAAVALRIAYSHGLESLFALLCATAQAPDCIVGWVLKYKNVELYEVIRKISERRPIYSKLHAKSVTWDVIADLIFTYLRTGDDEKDLQIRNSFARLWVRFASDYLNVNYGCEYNSIKHGLRVKMGGSYFSLGVEDTPGVPAPPERMRIVGQSDFGSSFFIPDKLHDSRNFSIRHHRLNWNPQCFFYALHLISFSITNVLGFLKISYGVPANEVQFSWPTEDSMYQEPWNRSTGMTLNWNSPITESDITPLSKEDIVSVYAERSEEEDNEDSS
jgi:hypothetical protein